MNKEIKGTIKVISPLHTGSDVNAGIDRLYRRMDIFVNNKIEQIPIISGNSIRGIMRDLIAVDLIEKLKLKNLQLSVYDLLFSGGSLQKGSKTGVIDVLKVNKIRYLFPMLALFGGCLSNHIMQGEFNCGYAWLVCQETNNITGLKNKSSYIDFLGEDFGTRQDNVLQDIDKINAKEFKVRKQPIQMKYNYEVIIPGAKFVQEFQVNTIDKITESAFTKTLELFINYSFLGARSSSGFGKVDLDYDLSKLEKSKLYDDFIIANQKDIIDELQTL